MRHETATASLTWGVQALRSLVEEPTPAADPELEAIRAEERDREAAERPRQDALCAEGLTRHANRINAEFADDDARRHGPREHEQARLIHNDARGARQPSAPQAGRA